MDLIRLKFIFIIIFSSFICNAQNVENEKAEQEVIKWLQKNAVPIKSASPEVKEDLSFLSEIVGNADLVLLGEGTHGTKEFYQIRDKIGRYLIEKENFRTVGIEYDFVNGMAVKTYVDSGKGSVEEALNEQRGWVWNNEETLEMVKWLRKHNQQNKEKVSYFGIDMLRIVPSLLYSLKHLKSHKIKEVLEIERQLKELIGKEVYEFENSGNDFYTNLSGDVPLENNYRFKEITSLLVDIFDLHKDKIISQSSGKDWSINRQIAYTALQKSRHLLQWNMNNIFLTFGRQKQSEIYSKAGSTSKSLENFYKENDFAQYKIIQPVLELISNPYRGNRKYRNLSIKERGKLLESIISSISRLEVRKYLYLKSVDENRLDEIKSELKTVLDIFEIYKNYLAKPALSTNEREIGLAENVKWIQNFTNSRMIVWAHNGHVSKKGNSETDMMGTLLKNWYKDNIVIIGTTFNKGNFQASYSVRQTNADTSKIREFKVGDAKKNSIERLMAQVSHPIFIIDFRKLPKKGVVHKWFTQKHYVRSIGNSFNPDKPDNYYELIEIPKHYDVMIFVNETKRAKPTRFVRQKCGLN